MSKEAERVVLTWQCFRYNIFKRFIRPVSARCGYQALRDVDFSVEEGEFVSVMGESGSGKTTLLNILAALDKPTEGAVFLDGQPLAGVPDRKLSAFRRDRLGFVFQDFNLLDTFTLRDNIFLPLVLARRRTRRCRQNSPLWLRCLRSATCSTNTRTKSPAARSSARP